MKCPVSLFLKHVNYSKNPYMRSKTLSTPILHHLANFPSVRQKSEVYTHTKHQPGNVTICNDIVTTIKSNWSRNVLNLETIWCLLINKVIAFYVWHIKSIICLANLAKCPLTTSLSCFFDVMLFQLFQHLLHLNETDSYGPTNLNTLIGLHISVKQGHHPNCANRSCGFAHSSFHFLFSINFN